MSLTVKLALTPLLVAQALATRSRMPRLPEADGERSGQVGRGVPLGLLVAGDSSAAGVGVVTQREALAGPLAARVAALCGARVQWQLHARSGLTTAGTHQLLQRAPLGAVDVAVIVSGVNDVVEQVPSQRAVAAREALANWLRNACGVLHVVYAPLPPVHQFPGLPQPLRWVAGSDARRHNAALRAWAATRSDVSCADLAVTLDAAGMAHDGFHPGVPVYAACAESIARHIAAAVWPQLPHAPTTPERPAR